MEEAQMKTIVSVTTAAAILAGSLAGLQAQTKSHVISAVKDAQWGPAPPVLPPVVNPTPPARTVHIPEIYIRRGNDIVLAPAEDQAVAQRYFESQHGDVHGGLRMTLLTARTIYHVREPVRVLHVVEAVDASASAFVMGPKPVYGERLDGIDLALTPEMPDYPWVGVYDGAVVPGPAADVNFDVTTYTFAEPGRHVIEWKLGALRSNQLVIDVR